jgi:hypothetical protein
VVQVECCQFWIVLDFHYEPPVTPSGGRLLQVGANLVAVGNKDSYHRCPIRLEYWSADPPAVAWDDSVEVAVTCSGNVEVWSLHELRQLPPALVALVLRRPLLGLRDPFAAHPVWAGPRRSGRVARKRVDQDRSWPVAGGVGGHLEGPPS